MLTDLVFLNSLSIDELMASYNYQIGLWYQAKNIDMIPLSFLGEMLNVASYETLMEGFIPVSEPAEKMLFSFPIELQAKLKTITDSEINSVINNWSKIEEFRNSMSSEECKKYLIDVRNFLNKSDESVYLAMGI
jgi:hypothetical protein